MKRSVSLIACAALAALVVLRFDQVAGLLALLWGALLPFALGCALAYLLNLIMARLERLWPAAKGPAAAARRPVCLTLSVVLVAAALTGIVLLVEDEVRDAVLSLWHGASAAVVALVDALEARQGATGLDLSWLQDLDKVLEGGLPSVLSQLDKVAPVASTLLGYGSKVAGGVMDFVVALVFALYLLADKERVAAGARRASRLLLPGPVFGRLTHVLRVADECFSRFIFGQCVEGIVLGSLCAIGMRVLGLPYAATVGLVVGIGALVPIVGAWTAGIVGALMIFPVDPMQSVAFVVFLLVLQQVDGHLIYPHVVGSAVGVSSLWILVSVFVGGALFGIAGVLFGVPFVATVRTLALEWAARREASSGGGDPDATPATGEPSA